MISENNVANTNDFSNIVFGFVVKTMVPATLFWNMSMEKCFSKWLSDNVVRPVVFGTFVLEVL